MGWRGWGVVQGVAGSVGMVVHVDMTALVLAARSGVGGFTAANTAVVGGSGATPTRLRRAASALDPVHPRTASQSCTASRSGWVRGRDGVVAMVEPAPGGLELQLRRDEGAHPRRPRPRRHRQQHLGLAPAHVQPAVTQHGSRIVPCRPPVPGQRCTRSVLEVEHARLRSTNDTRHVPAPGGIGRGRRRSAPGRRRRWSAAPAHRGRPGRPAPRARGPRPGSDSSVVAFAPRALTTARGPVGHPPRSPPSCVRHRGHPAQRRDPATAR